MPPSADPCTHAAGAPRIGIVSDRPDWHSRELTKALKSLGVGPVAMRLEACAFDTGSATGLRLDGFGERLPDAVFVRTIEIGRAHV